MVTHGAWMNMYNGSEHQNWEAMMALNAKTENDDGSERQNWKWWWLLISKLRNGDRSERQVVNADDFECRSWEMVMTLSTKTEKR